jgi:hypothetical protein
VVTTDTPGFQAEIQGGGSAEGPFDSLSSLKSVAGSTAFDLQSKPVRYVLVWITQLPPGSDHADVNEVKAFG